MTRFIVTLCISVLFLASTAIPASADIFLKKKKDSSVEQPVKKQSPKKVQKRPQSPAVKKAKKAPAPKVAPLSTKELQEMQAVSTPDLPKCSDAQAKKASVIMRDVMSKYNAFTGKNTLSEDQQRQLAAANRKLESNKALFSKCYHRMDHSVFNP